MTGRINDEMVQAAVDAMREAAGGFEAPVALYVEGEALRRFEHSNPDIDPYRGGRAWDRESWALLVKPALEAALAVGPKPEQSGEDI